MERHAHTHKRLTRTISCQQPNKPNHAHAPAVCQHRRLQAHVKTLADTDNEMINDHRVTRRVWS